MFRTTIYGQPVSWKNSAMVTKNRVPIKSKAQRRWAKEATRQLRAVIGTLGIQTPLVPKDVEINAKIVSYLGTKRLIDASNLYQGPEDVMQVVGILEDDSCIVSHDGSDRQYDKENPRVEIELTRKTRA